MFFCSTRCRASLMCHPNGRCLLLETLTWPCVAFAPRVSVTFRLEVTEQAEPVQTPRLRCSTHGCCHRAVVAHTAVVTEALQAVQHRTWPLSQSRCKQCSTAPLSSASSNCPDVAAPPRQPPGARGAVPPRIQPSFSQPSILQPSVLQASLSSNGERMARASRLRSADV